MDSDRRVHHVWQVGTETDADVEGAFDVEFERRAVLRHGFALEADEQRERVSALLDADSFGEVVDQRVRARALRTSTAANTKLAILRERTLLGTLRELDHAEPMQRHYDLFGVVVETLAYHQHRFSIAVALGIRERDIGGERHIAGHLLPQEAELVARVPDVVAGGVDGVSLRGGIVRRASGHQCGADVGLTVEDSDGFVDGDSSSMKVTRRRHLLVRGGAGDRPIRHGGFRRLLRQRRQRKERDRQG